MRNEMHVAGAILGTVAGDCLGRPYVFMKSASLFEMARQICWQIEGMGAVSHLMLGGIWAHYRHGFALDALVRGYYQRLAKAAGESDMVTAQFFAHGAKSRKASKLYEMAQNADLGALCSGQLLVRQIPVVLGGCALSTEALAARIASEVRLTHVDDECIELAQVFGLCLQGILRGFRRVEVWDALFAFVKNRNVYRTLLASYYEKPVCDLASYSQAHVTLQMALYHYWHDTPFVSAVRDAVLSGGATDVNAAATGCLIGAVHGLEVIPDTWRQIMLHDMPDCDTLRRAVLLGERLSGARIGTKPVRVRDGRIAAIMRHDHATRRTVVQIEQKTERLNA